MIEFRWASDLGLHGMATPDELEYLGYTPWLRDGRECRHPWYRHAVLMAREAM